MKLYIRVVTGFRKDQEITIESEEAHKAYYLFLHPDSRGIFKNGVALIGRDIQRIEPNYQKTMGWKEDYKMIGEDFDQIRKFGVDKKMIETLQQAKDISLKYPDKINIGLSQLLSLPS